jgi:hypothetical protein
MRSVLTGAMPRFIAPAKNAAVTWQLFCSKSWSCAKKWSFALINVLVVEGGGTGFFFSRAVHQSLWDSPLLAMASPFAYDRV